MSDSVVVNVISPEVTNINVTDTGENIYINPLTLNQGIINHSVTHQSGGSDELLHNLLGGLQGGSDGNYYHLTSGEYANLVTGAVIRPSDTGAFYPNSNPSGFITGVDLSAYVTGDVVRPSETGNFITTSQTGAFYPRSNPSGFIVPSQTGAFYAASNPSGFITGVDLSAYVTGDVVRPSQTGAFYPASNPSGFITGVDLSFSGNYYTKSESESRYVNTTGAETILGDKTFHDKVYINNLYVTGLETIVNTTNTNVASNFIMLNLTGGAVDGGLFFVTGSGLTGINDSGAILGFDHSDKFKFGIGTRASDLSVLDTIASVEEMTGISGGLQQQITTLNNQTGSYVLNSATGDFITTAQTGAFYPASNPSGYITGIDLSSYATITYVTGISGNLQQQITTLNNQTGGYVLDSETGNFITTTQTGVFYPTSNPSGFVTGSVVRPSETGIFLTTTPASFTSDTLATALSDENGSSGGFVRAEGATLSSLGLSSIQQSAIDRIYSNQTVVGSPAAAFFDDFLGNTTNDLNWELSFLSPSFTDQPSQSSVNSFGLLRLNTSTGNTSFRSHLLRAYGGTPQGAITEICFAIPTFSSMSYYGGLLRFGGVTVGVTADTDINSGRWTFLSSGSASSVLITGASLPTGAIPQNGDFVIGKKYRVRTEILSVTGANIRILECDATSNSWSTVFDETIETPTQDRTIGQGSPIFSVRNKSNQLNRILITDWFSYSNPTFIR